MLTPTPIHVRPATPADANALARLSAEAFTAKFGHLYPPETLDAFLAETYAEPAIAALIAAPAIDTWLVDDGHTLLAYAMLAPAKLPHAEVSPGCIELRRLYTAPNATGRGLGARLMHEVVIPACKAANGDAWLGVYADNHGAQRFYARYGFRKAGEYEFPVGPIRDREFILRRHKD